MGLVWLVFDSLKRDVNARRRIRETIAKISAQQVDPQVITESGEDLATLLGEVIETKVRIFNLLFIVT